MVKQFVTQIPRLFYRENTFRRKHRRQIKHFYYFLPHKKITATLLVYVKVIFDIYAFYNLSNVLASHQ